MPLSLFSAHIKVFALVDVKEDGRRRRLPQFSQTILRSVEKAAQARFVRLQPFSPFIEAFLPTWISRIELPCPNKGFDQRPNWVGTRPQTEKTPTTTVAKGWWPGACIRRMLREILTQQSSEHASSRQGRFSDAG